jgi:hypothetical protein
VSQPAVPRKFRKHIAAASAGFRSITICNRECSQTVETQRAAFDSK